MTDADDTARVLEEWAARLGAELGIEAPVDIDAILRLAGVAAHAVIRPAAPVTTWIAGYAAGVAASTDAAQPDLPRIESLAREFGTRGS